ncbi:MAG: hypothetical protein LKM31_00720 [Sphingobium sp.]|nr:hypothetical protein [Sphingobium sp.]
MGEKHFMRILSDINPAPDKETRRLVLCSGKVAYDLIEARDAAGDKNTQVVRIEQLYPFPTRSAGGPSRPYDQSGRGRVVQEEPRNMA